MQCGFLKFSCYVRPGSFTFLLMLISIGEFWEIFRQMTNNASKIALCLDVLWCTGVYGGIFSIVLQKTEGNPGLAARVEELLIGLISRGKIVMIEDNTPRSDPVFLPPSTFITLIVLWTTRRSWQNALFLQCSSYEYFFNLPIQKHVCQVWVGVNSFALTSHEDLAKRFLM